MSEILIEFPTLSASQDDGGVSYFSQYASPVELDVNRKGFFAIAWSSYQKKLNENEIIHHQCATLLSLNKNQKFFKFKTGKSLFKPKKILVTLLMDPWLSPLYLIRDSLNQLKSLINVNECESYLYIETFSAFNPAKHLDYLNGFYQMISDVLGQIPQKISATQLQKLSSMREWALFDGATQWFCSDNTIIHLGLSKGAAYLDLKNSNEFTPKESFSLSRYHELEVGLTCQRIDRETFELYEKFESEDYSKAVFNSLNIPDVFLATVYRKIE